MPKIKTFLGLLHRYFSSKTWKKFEFLPIVQCVPTLRAKRATYIFLKMPKMVNFGELMKTWKTWTLLPDRSLFLNRQKMVENAKVEKFKCNIFSNFQTLWIGQNLFGYLVLLDCSRKFSFCSYLSCGTSLSSRFFCSAI